jgi:hypothetical protein
MSQQTRTTVPVVAAITLAINIFSLDTAKAVDEASYEVLESESDFELRRYAPQVVAETLVEGDFDDVGNEGFRRLSGYIFGKNQRQQSVSMTAPVSQEPVSQKIAMTAPVNQEPVGDAWRITFVMPAEYKLEDLPIPEDERVVLKELGARLVAAIRYSGTWSESRYNEKEALLMDRLESRGLNPKGSPVFARYNPPFMPWFLRRNEVLIEVEHLPQ